MKVRKAVIPAAGLGTRMLPATKTVPKEMLPMVDKPVIQYIIEEAVASGIEDILIVTNRAKSAMDDYFDYYPELETRLLQAGKERELVEVRRAADLANIFYVRQKETKGLGHAIWRAKRFVGDEPFAVLLGDDIMRSQTPVIGQLIAGAEKYGASCVGVQQVSTDHCDAEGLTADRFQETGTAFVMAKLALEYVHPITAGSRLRLVTEPAVPQRAVYRRFTTITDAEGREVCRVAARWVLIDVKQRHILRTHPGALAFPFSEEVNRTLDLSIPRSTELEPAGEYTAAYSRTDRNGHLNNACYADLVCDVLPPEVLCQRPIRRMAISYHEELRLGETMELFLGKTGEDTYYICGKKGGRRCFEASVTLGEKEKEES